jgi:multiple sugar transport system permease protein
LKREVELVQKPITYWPHNPTVQNYVQAFTDQPLLKYLGNSFMVAMLATVVSLLVSAFAAYAIARLNLKRRQLILTCIVASSMFPLVTLLVPIFETMRALDLLNTYTALVLPYTVLNLPICTLVLVSFFQSIPRDLENAAMIDGCTRLGALWKVVVPLAAPGVFTAGILAFVNAWDEFLLALSLNSSAAMRTAPVGITLYQGEFTFPWPIISAALIVTIVPVAILIAIFQERVVGGLTQGGLKG